MARLDTPVLIAGAGPVGLLVALELAHNGVGCILIDRSRAATKFPKMDITNGRSMELFRRLGIADAVRAAGVGADHHFDVLFALADGAAPFGRWHLPSVADQRRAIADRNDGTMTLEPSQRIPQSAFEALGRELCRANPLIDFREGFAFETLEQDAHGVAITATATDTGEGLAVRAGYLIGCDGAGSRVRRQLDIALATGPDSPPNYMIHFRSDDLGALHGHGRFWHYFVNGSVLISQNEADAWTFHAPLLDGPFETDPDPAQLIFEKLGLAPRIDEVLLTSLWQPRFALAERYRAGRVFLAGDAVHQVFPTGGYGMNTGVGDAIDIGWKLAAVINGWGGEGLLDSYEAERRPVGATNWRASERHLGVIIAIAQQAQAGASRDTLGRFAESNRGENEFDGIEFGYRYEASPVIVHEDGPAPPWHERDYVPSSWPGARPPSFLLADGTALFDKFGAGLTLVDGAGDAAPLVTAAAARAIPMTHVAIDEAAVKTAWERNYVLVRPDHHVAWRSDTLPDPAEWAAILRVVLGHANVVVTD